MAICHACILGFLQQSSAFLFLVIDNVTHIYFASFIKNKDGGDMISDRSTAHDSKVCKAAKKNTQTNIFYLFIEICKIVTNLLKVRQAETRSLMGQSSLNFAWYRFVPSSHRARSC